MCVLHFTTQHPTQHWTRICSALKITETSKISLDDFEERRETLSYEIKLQKHKLLQSLQNT